MVNLCYLRCEVFPYSVETRLLGPTIDHTLFVSSSVPCTYPRPLLLRTKTLVGRETKSLLTHIHTTPNPLLVFSNVKPDTRDVRTRETKRTKTTGTTKCTGSGLSFSVNIFAKEIEEETRNVTGEVVSRRIDVDNKTMEFIQMNIPI